MWIKSMTNQYDRDAMKLIDTLQERDTIYYIYNRLMLQAGKINDYGLVYFGKGIPYSDEMLAAIFNRPKDVINNALEVLINFNLIEITKEGFIKMSYWDVEQNVDAIEKAKDKTRKRVANYRNKQKEKKEAEKNSTCNDNCNNDVTDKNVTVTTKNKKEEKNKEDIELEKDKDEEVNNKEKDDAFNDKAILTEDKKHQVGNSSGDTFNDKVIPLSSGAKNSKDLSSLAIEIINHYEKLTGKIGNLKINQVKIAIETYGLENVKFAIDKSIEVNKFSMSYINGILKNLAKSNLNKGVKVNDYSITREDYGASPFKSFSPEKSREYKGNLAECEENLI